MHFRSYTLKYAAVFFLFLLFLLVAGMLAYMLWYSNPPEPPQRSMPVMMKEKTETKGGCYFDDGGQSN